MKSLQIELLSRKRQRRDHFFWWWSQFSIVLSSCKGPFKAWFELAVRTTLLRVRLLTKTVTKRECDVLLVTIWKYTYRNLETAETKCSGVSRGGPPLSQPPPPPTIWRSGSAKGGKLIYPMMPRGKFVSSLRGGKSVRGFRGRFSTTWISRCSSSKVSFNEPCWSLVSYE